MLHMSRWSWLILLAKIIVSAALLLLLATKIDLAAVLAALVMMPAWVFLVSLGFLLLQALLLAWRWHRVTKWMGSSLAIRPAVRLTFVGLFFNQTLPTSIGGDAIRIWGAYRVGVPLDAALSSVLIERSTGLASIALVVAISVLALPPEILGGPMRWMLLAPLPLAIVGLAVLAISDAIPVQWVSSNLAMHVATLARGLRRIAGSPAAVAELFTLGVLAAVVGITQTYLVGSQIGIPLGLASYLVVVGGACLITVLPISIAGWGVREAAIVGLFSEMGIDAEKSLVVSVIFGLSLMIVACPGGILWIIDGATRRRTS